jgi:uncharacterized repeat protein (TIGR03803 family)
MRISTNNIAVALLSATILAACGGNGFSSSATTPAARLGARLSQSAGVTTGRAHVRAAYRVLYRFKGYPDDGGWPFASLIDVGGTLYGTTGKGGSHECRTKNRGCGTVFAITMSGGEAVLYSFKGKKGTVPEAALLDVSGTLYGTTSDGGANHYDGTVFNVTTSGAETVLHSFGRLGDGSGPHASLVNVKGTLFGTTYGGGADNRGTVFTITTSGNETVLHSFGGSGDGEGPVASLINVNGTLYGTTEAGGAKGDGTVFAITPSGTETVLYSFTGGGDGEVPAANLLDVSGTLYGTTEWGGSGGCNGPSGDSGCGTVFKVTTSGKETLIHSFAGGSGDGALPQAGLINVKGTLYGTTTSGGANCNSSGGCGTLFKIATSGTETVLHSFAGYPNDGEEPVADLINVEGTLYGTTAFGGPNSDGTVFSLSP